MKKILSILISVVLGVTTAWAAIGTGETNKGLITISVTSSPKYAGDLTVQTQEAKSADVGLSTTWTWHAWQTWTSSSTVSGDAYSKTAKRGYGIKVETAWIGINYAINAEARPGYKFESFTGDIGAANGTLEGSTIEGQTDYKSSNTQYSFTANFECLHQYKHTAKAVAVAYEGIPVGRVSVDRGTLKTDLSTVTSWSNPENVNNEYVFNEETDGNTSISEVDQVADATNEEIKLSYTFNYYAEPLSFDDVEGMEGMKFVFDGWYANEECEGEPISRSPYYANTVTIDPSQYSDSEKTTHDPSTKPLYAKFRFDAYYYYSGAIAGFALNGEKVGKITVAADVSDASTDEATTSAYTASTTNDLIQDNNIYKVLPKSSVNYSYTYTISEIPDDAKATFMGWSASPYGGTYLQHEPSYQYTGEYTTYSLENTPEMASPTPPVYAVFLSYWYKDPTVLLTTSSQGLGTVTATYSEEVPNNGWTTGQVGTIINQEKIDLDNPDGFTYDVYYHAKKLHGSYFKGWAKVNNPNNLIADNSVNPYHERYTVTSTDKNSPFTPPTVYAVFESDIAILQQDKMICYQNVDGVTNINDAKVIINFNKANTITATLKGDWANYFEISDKAQTVRGNEVVLNTSEGLVTLIVSYKKDKPLNQAIGKVAEIELSTNYGGGDVTRDLLVAVETVPVVTFLPTDGKGAYVIKHTDGSGIEYEMPLNEKENVDIFVTQESLSTIEMSIEDNTEDDYHFYGWQLTTSSGDEFISYDEKCTYAFSEPSIVRPVFTTSDVAVFTILGDPSEIQYDDLQKAIDDAAAMGGNQVVVFSNNGNPTGTLAQGNYVIKQNVTLLIPGVGPGDDVTMPSEADENKYVYRLKKDGVVTSIATEIALTVDDYLDDEVTSSTAPAKCFRKLIVSGNTTITVESGANLYLYALTNRYQQAYEARPHRYGQMVLGENCQINLQSGASLYAFGYITGAYSSRVIANSGAEVHELFQYSDPRGGSGVAHLFLFRKAYKVFPFSQYYVQNIEIPLELKFGSVEYITTTADVLNSYVVMAKFVIPNNGAGITSNTSGLFRLGDNASLIKYYDPIADRQKYIIKGEAANPASVRLGRIHIQMGDVSGTVGDMVFGDGFLGNLAGAAAGTFMKDLKNVQLNSKEYVLPLNNNMDVLLENAALTITSDFAFLAGSTLTIDKKSSLTVNAATNVYVYDADENRLPGSGENYGKGYGYYGNENYVLEQIVSTPNNSHLLSDNSTLKRQPDAVKDSKWVVNGKVIVAEGGGFYTTAGGAQITSTGNGQVEFKQSLADATTYQAKYVTSDKTKLLSEEGTHNKVAYAVNSAKLQHADGTYQTTTAGTYTYNPATGKWETNVSANTVSGHQFTVTLPSPATVNKTVIANLSGVTSADDITATIAWNGGASTAVSGITYNNGLNIPISYAVTNKAGEYEGVLTIKSGTTTIATPRITVTEDYTPAFTINGEDNPKYTTSARLGYQSESEFGIIVPKANNVAGLVSGTYTSNWSYEITGENADEFSLVWGEGDAKLTNSKVVFKPKTVGSKKTATLSVTCTYTDAAKVAHTTTVAIALEASATTLTTNTLAFADGVEQIFISDAPTSLFANETGNGQPITITLSANNVVTLGGATEDKYSNTATIAPQANAAGKSVTITATQPVNISSGVAATSITKIIQVTEDIVWNWDKLYFGSTNTNPITTKYQDQDWSLDLTEDIYNVILNPTLVEDGIDGWVAKVAPWEEGETTVKFTMTYWDGEQEKTKEFTSEVYRDPRYLSLSVSEDRIYEAVTEATVATVEFAMGYLAFNSEEMQPAQWTFSFMGIPDELSFTATGLNNWQIEESPNGTNWTIAYTWAKIAAGAPFELSLQPSTRYVRISYGTEHSEVIEGQEVRLGTLSNITVTELKTVKADVSKLYMPIPEEGKSTVKNVVYTYVSEDGFDLITTGEGISASPNKLTGSNADPFYRIERVAVTSVATQELLGSLDVDKTDTKIPIQTFAAPQAIPIQLASDHAERYYYVVEQSYQTTWDASELAVVMHNAVADAAPYVVFHFADNPTPGIMSFTYSELSDGATWVVEESADGTDWKKLSVNSAENTEERLVMREFKYPEQSRYLRIKLESDYAEVISLFNVSILPTANVVVDPASMTVFDDNNEKLSIKANNLQDVTFTISDGFQLVKADGTPLTTSELTTLFVGTGTKPGDIYVKFLGTKNDQPLTVSEGKLTITTTKDAQGNDHPVVLATVELLGVKRTLAAGATGIYTGVKTTAAEGEIAYKINGFTEADGAEYREVDVTHAFASDTPLFDYVIIYGATTTDDESTTITTPTSTSGSNAKTPCYIYKKVDGAYKLVDLTYVVENANASTKSWKGAISISDTEVGVVDAEPEHLKVYITGFAPYASTGYSKADDGVWHFKGDAGDKIDIYLEDCYIYSRYKTKRGNSFSRSNGETFSDKVVRGSGAVLMFENNTQADAVTTTMDVTIHTRGTNLLKSHYGCLFESIVGRAFQVSAPVQIYMQSESHVRNSYTVLNFTDEWPTAIDANTGEVTNTERTNGFISLRKQVNNAPSIDMGNTNTVVNFRGGQVELQNACNSSDNYESTLAISARSGIMGPAKFRFRLAYGIGTDEVGGRVNFYDGTTTVITMTVPERYRQYYLMDGENEELPTTSCLRTPKKTFIYGGSHCMMRACTEPTSKGGAPTDGDYHLENEVVDGSNVSKEVITGNPLGLYQYTNSAEEGWTAKEGNEGTYGLVTPTHFPDGLKKDDNTTLADVHAGYTGGKYGVESITPTNGVLNFWIPGGFKRDGQEVGKQPEVEKMISYWKACMTYIEAKYGVYEGNIGGPTSITFDGAGNQTEQVQNLLYCEIDKNIYNVISSSDYAAPVLNPAPVENAADKYMSIAPTKIGVSDDPYADPELKNNITNEDPYVVQNKAYYIVPAQADIWMAFTAPFNVKNIYIMETRAEDDLMVDAEAVEEDYKNNPSKYPEYTLENPFTWREAMLKAQARHNADFASFFGVAMALDSKKPFNEIYQDYIGWAKLQDGGTTERSKYLLTHFDGDNWNTAQYYLYENGGVEKYDEETLKVNWNTVPLDREVLMKKGMTYSLFFPYCMGCWEDGKRDFWDYWTGKFLIFESTDGNADGHWIDGTQSQNWQGDFDSGNEIHMFGNTSLSDVQLAKSESIFPYSSEIADLEAFIPMEEDVMLKPTQSFLYANITAPIGQKVTRINRDGKINYGPTNSGDGNTTGTHMPTVGGGNDLFITAINGGINVAVAYPQHVRVLSATGAVIYSGMVQTAVDVNLPTDGIYIVSGEREVQKILY